MTPEGFMGVFIGMPLRRMDASIDDLSVQLKRLQSVKIVVNPSTTRCHPPTTIHFHRRAACAFWNLRRIAADREELLEVRATDP